MHKSCTGIGSRVQMSRIDWDRWVCRECMDEQGRKEREERLNGQAPLQDVRDGVNGGLRVMQWNCDHLVPRIPELEVWLEEKKVDVALVQETKLRAEDGEVRVCGFEMIRRDRDRTGRSRFSRGGGLVTLVRRGLGYRIRKGEVPSESGIEVLWVEVVDRLGGVWNCVNVYAPPDRVLGECGQWFGLIPGSREGRWIVGGGL